jgi:hypothetical protein
VVTNLSMGVVCCIRTIYYTFCIGLSSATNSEKCLTVTSQVDTMLSMCVCTGISISERNDKQCVDLGVRCLCCNSM